jgi:branched-chain amino acid transport system ATP-binding protein
MLRVIGGLIAPTAGQVTFRHELIAGLLPHAIQQRGIGYVLQGGRVFPNLTVQQNIEIAKRNARSQVQEHRPCRIEGIPTSLHGRRNVRAGLLSGGERHLLAMELILAQNPVLLLLDEPTAGLAPDLVAEITNSITAFAATPDHAVLLVEQNVDNAKRIAHRCLTLESGVVVNENAGFASNTLTAGRTQK